MSKEAALQCITDGLADLSSSEIRVLESVALSQREQNPARTGLVKLWTGIFCLLSNERKRRVELVQKTEMDYYDLPEPIIEWGKKDPENSATFKVYYPKEIKEDPDS